MRTLITGTIVLVRLALAAPVSGQRPDSLRDTARIAPVVVTATSTPVALNRVPASVTVLDGATLRAEGLTHVADALRQGARMADRPSAAYGRPACRFTPGGP